jgi:hypothetical protein
VTGAVCSFNGRYGFIRAGDREAKADFFFLPSDVIGEVRSGDEVDFWLADSTSHPGELVAVEVKRREDGRAL